MAFTNLWMKRSIFIYVKMSFGYLHNWRSGSCCSPGPPFRVAGSMWKFQLWGGRELKSLSLSFKLGFFASQTPVDMHQGWKENALYYHSFVFLFFTYMTYITRVTRNTLHHVTFLTLRHFYYNYNTIFIHYLLGYSYSTYITLLFPPLPPVPLLPLF